MGAGGVMPPPRGYFQAVQARRAPAARGAVAPSSGAECAGALTAPVPAGAHGSPRRAPQEVCRRHDVLIISDEESDPPPLLPPPSCTNWTRLVPPSVLTGHVS
jgi:hypothetical protein